MSRLLILAAAGLGTRLGRNEPKALVPVAGKPLVSWSLDAFATLRFARAVAAVPPGFERQFEEAIGSRAFVVAGGNTRAASVRAAYAALGPAREDFVCIHDAARPLVSASEVEAVIEQAERTGAAIAATPVVDTLKHVSDGKIVVTLDRNGLYAAATPQVFRADLLAAAWAKGVDATDEAALVEATGVAVSVVAVSRLSFKVTTREDVKMVDAILSGRRP